LDRGARGVDPGHGRSYAIALAENGAERAFLERLRESLGLA